MRPFKCEADSDVINYCILEVGTRNYFFTILISVVKHSEGEQIQSLILANCVVNPLNVRVRHGVVII